MTQQAYRPAKGDRVQYQRWTGEVYEVLSDGSTLIDFTLCSDPIPFFRGPYKPEELTPCQGEHEGLMT